MTKRARPGQMIRVNQPRGRQGRRQQQMVIDISSLQRPGARPQRGSNRAYVPPLPSAGALDGLGRLGGRGPVPHLSHGYKPGQSKIAQAPQLIAKSGWRHRWRLTPLVGYGVVLWAAVGAAGVTSVALAVLARTFDESSRLGEVKILKRRWLTMPERAYAATWCRAACLVTLVWTFAPQAHVVLYALALAAWVGLPSYRWATSRAPILTGKISAEGRNRLRQWTRVSTHSSGALHGSRIIQGTAKEPAPGTLTFDVQLLADVHGEVAQGEMSRISVEALLGLPPDCVQISKHKGNSTRVHVTMTPGRHLEMNEVPWPGPEITKDGLIALGDSSSGKLVQIPRQNEKGVNPMRLSGNTGNGKSSTIRVICIACASTVSAVEVPDFPPEAYPNGVPEETLWLIDGKGGSSVPEIRNVFDWYAWHESQWLFVLQAFYNVLVDRKYRRGQAGLSSWRCGHEVDPIISLTIDESSAVVQFLRRINKLKTFDKMVLECLQHERALGMSIRQSSQDSIGENWLGNRPAREIMSKGAAIMHRPGGHTGQMYARDGSTEQVKLLALPPEPGFAAVMVNGQTVASVMRVRNCTEDQARAWAEHYKPRPLTGADLAAAGEAYAKRHEDLVLGDSSALSDSSFPVPVGVRAPARVGLESGSGSGTGIGGADIDLVESDGLTHTQHWISKVLAFTSDGMTVEQLVEKGNGKRGRSQSNIYNGLSVLRERGLVTQDGPVYKAATPDKPENILRDEEGTRVTYGTPDSEVDQEHTEQD